MISSACNTKYKSAAENIFMNQSIIIKTANFVIVGHFGNPRGVIFDFVDFRFAIRTNSVWFVVYGVANRALVFVVTEQVCVPGPIRLSHFSHLK